MVPRNVTVMLLDIVARVDFWRDGGVLNASTGYAREREREGEGRAARATETIVQQRKASECLMALDDASIPISEGDSSRQENTVCGTARLHAS